MSSLGVSSKNEENTVRSVPKVLYSVLPDKSKIENIVVRTISPVEKLFKITLDGGTVRYIQVKKENEKYVIANK